MIRFYDVDWRCVLNDWDESDLRYLASIIEEKLIQLDVCRCRSHGTEDGVVR